MSIYVALLAGCVLTMILGKFVLAELRKLKAGQEIRQDGPTWHNSKAGTPTMGGIAFILGSGIVTFACGWQQMLAGDFAHLYVYLFALIFGLIGFVDDYRKVRQHQNEGLTAKQKFVLQLLASDMKKKLKKWLRPVLFTLGGALMGLGYYALVGCSTGSCAITASPVNTILYMGLMGWLLSGIFGSQSA